MQKLLAYHWPGNVRELRHALERAVIMADSQTLLPSDFLFTAESSIENVVFDTSNLEEIEKLVIRKALQKHQGNISRAAQELGLTRTSLYRRMEKYAL